LVVRTTVPDDDMLLYGRKKKPLVNPTLYTAGKRSITRSF
jgi:hypothetical protein